MIRQPLKGVRVLIVEDRYMVASEVADEVVRLGGEVVGPAGNLSTAADLLANSKVDAALLDVNLDGELVFPLAEVLTDRKLPFIFLTGYDASTLPAEWRGRPHLVKPLNRRTLCEELTRLKLPSA